MDQLIEPNDLILITGSTGFVGKSLVRALLRMGMKNIQCLTRPSSDTTALTL